MNRDKVEGVAKILAGAHPAESLGNIAREIIAYLEGPSPTGSRIPEAVLYQKIKDAIGYELVPLSIRDHPEIKFEYRTTEDRDGLIERIMAALLPLLQTAWIPVDLLFRDRYSGQVRHAPYMLVEVVKHGNEVLFQDAENGTHRMVSLQHIENTRAAVKIEAEAEKYSDLEERGL
ncbi:hypothetical protein SEA_TINYMINY_73 [Microbacterium phage TinyMiny]|nr:hypothetical protein SEA_TINYMINY_73 [Microbacterium phage TinyMiny]